MRELLCLTIVPCLLLLAVAVGCAKETPGGKAGPLVTTDTVTKDGITWQFAEKVQVGQFVTGDYYVVGPVTITAITPAPTENRNGSVLNVPPDPGRSGFDDRAQGNRFDAGMRAKLPLQVRPGDALISSISVDKMGELPAPMRPSDKSGSPVRTISILTCLDQAVPVDAFRPAYCRKPGAPATPTIYLARNLQWKLLPNLKHVKHTPDLAEWAERYRRPWLDTVFFGFDAPIEYMPHYGRELGFAAGEGSLLLMLDFPKEQKQKLLIGFVQRGLDLWGIVEAGGDGWQAHGGHGSGRKWPIIFAGLMLGDESMQRPYRKHPNLHFGEDMQTIHGQGWTGATALYAGHVGADGEKVEKGWGAYEHLQPREWPSMLGESYRRCCTSVAWVSQALAIRLMHAEKLWDHPAFLDYVDRWMTEDDTETLKAIKEQTGQDFSADYSRQRQAWFDFDDEMWATYRPTLKPPATATQAR